MPARHSEGDGDGVAHPVADQQGSRPLVAVAVAALQKPQAQRLPQLTRRRGHGEAGEVVKPGPAARHVDVEMLAIDVPAPRAQHVVDQRQAQQSGKRHRIERQHAMPDLFQAEPDAGAQPWP